MARVANLVMLNASDICDLTFFYQKETILHMDLFQKEFAHDEVLAAAAALHQDPFYPSILQPSHFLYSQGLASRNTNALFGLQGKP